VAIYINTKVLSRWPINDKSTLTILRVALSSRLGTRTQKWHRYHTGRYFLPDTAQLRELHLHWLHSRAHGRHFDVLVDTDGRILRSRKDR
jgi:hypothetical protein